MTAVSLLCLNFGGVDTELWCMHTCTGVLVYIHVR